MLQFNYTDISSGIVFNNVLGRVQNITISNDRASMIVPVAMLITPVNQTWNNIFAYLQETIPYSISSPDNPIQQAYFWLQNNLNSPIFGAATYYSPMNSIISFNINHIPGVVNGNSIVVTLPADTPVTALVPGFTTNGASSVEVNSTAQQSDVSVQDFTQPVNYVVTAQNGDIRTYVVTVSLN